MSELSLNIGSNEADLSSDHDATRGSLVCEQCAFMFPLINDIPRFVLDSGYAESFGFQWNRHSNTQLDSYSGKPISENRLFATTGWPSNMEGEIILEAGSGAGRFTEILVGTGAMVYSFDYSSAVDANYRNNGAKINLQLFQASIEFLPFCRYKFDKVLCLGVIQHTPDPQKFFKKLVEMVRPGGELVIDCYSRDFFALIQWKYLLRPLTKRMNQAKLYRFVQFIVPKLLPLAKILKSIGGRVGARMIPIVEYSNLGLRPELNREWAILDTFDMYSPAHDHPQSVRTIRRWYEEAGFKNIYVGRGQNGVIGRGQKA